MNNNVFSGTQIEERHMDIGASVVLGNQWGDEGKGKITDILAQTSDVIVRFNGGHNAGHTVKVGDKEFDLHILPSGMVSESKTNIITSGCVLGIDLNKIDLDKIDIKGTGCICNYTLEELLKRNNNELIRVGLIPELEKLEKGLININNSGLKISGETTVIGLHNVILDGLDEKQREVSGLTPIGSTGSGISRAYSSQNMRYHFTLSDLIYRNDLFNQSIEALWESYKHIFPLISTDELIKISNIEREKIIKYIKEGTIEIINDEVHLIDKLSSKGKKIVGEGAQSSMIGSGNSIFGTASEPSLQTFMNVTGISDQNVGNVFLVHKMPPSSVGIRPGYLKFPEGEQLNLFRKKYNEKGVSTGRDRDIFNYSLPETAKGGRLNTKGLSDDSKIIPVFNRVDGIQNGTTIDNEGKLRVITGFKYTVDKILKGGKSDIKVGVLGFENITPSNLLRHYPQKANQVDLFSMTNDDLRIVNIKGETINEQIDNLLGLHIAALVNNDEEREYLIGTGPDRDDLEIRNGSAIRTIQK